MSAAPDGEHLDEEVVQALAEGALDAAAAARVEAHMDACDACRALVAAVGRAAAPSLTPPGDAGEAPSAVLARGVRVARYVVEACVGSGAMGTVYAAYDPELDRRIALKIVSPRPGGISAARVTREAKAAARLSHPNVVAVYDVGTRGDDVFIAMELAKGTLRDWMRAERRSWQAVLAVFMQAGQGLAAAHAVGLVHRDFKPDNVLLDGEGRAKVADFGLARDAGEARASAPASSPLADDALALATTATATRTGAVVGTPAYAAPEQLRGAAVDARSDVFAFSVALHEALYGERPFAAYTAKDLLARIEADDVRPPAAGRDVPAWLRAVVLRGLASEPAARWPSMTALLDALRPPELARRSPRFSISGGWALGVVVVAAGGATASVFALRARVPHAAAPSASATAAAAAYDFHPQKLRRITFGDACEEFPSFAPDGKRLFYDGGRGDENVVFALDLATGETRTLTNGPFDYAASVSPDGARFAFYRGRIEQRGTYVAAIDGGGEARFLGPGLAHASWTKDGRGVWAGMLAQPTLYDAATGEVLRKLRPADKGYVGGFSIELAGGSLLLGYPQIGAAPGGGVARFAPSGERTWVVQGMLDDDLALSPRGDEVLFVRATETDDRELMIAPLDGSAPPRSLAATGVKPQKGMAFSPDGGTFVWSTCHAETTLAKLDEDGKLQRLHLPGGWSDHAAVAIPGTTSLVISDSTRGGTSQTWRVDTREVEPPRVIDTGGVKAAATEMAVTSDGRTLAFFGDTGGLYVMPVEGGAPRKVSEGRSAWPPAFAADGKQIFYARNESDGSSGIVVVNADGSGEKPLLEGDSITPAASPTEPLLFYSRAKGAGGPRLFDLRTHASRLLSKDLPPAANYARAQFSHDGTRIVVSSDEGIFELRVADGAIVRKNESERGTESVTYVGQAIYLTHTEWVGDLWAADVAR